MQSLEDGLEVTFARSEGDVLEAQGLRYTVFVEELGATAIEVDHKSRIEADAFDASARHLLLWDRSRPNGSQIVGTYRLIMSEDSAPSSYSSDHEFDLSALLSQKGRKVELSRSCIHSDYRTGKGMFLMWQALTRFVKDQEVAYLFGVASFHGCDLAPLAEPINLLQKEFLAPKSCRPICRAPAPIPVTASEKIDRISAMKAVPSLLKAYLRLGGKIGEGAFIDHQFNTVDLCVVVDLQNVDQTRRAVYEKPRP